MGLRDYIPRWRRARAIRRAKLPWEQLEAEAQRQGCDPLDVFFDRTGRPGPAAGAQPSRDIPPRR